jgi:hypothetical protein
LPLVVIIVIVIIWKTARTTVQALDDAESSVGQKLTKRLIEFHYSINWQHPAAIPRVHLFLMSVFLDLMYTMLHK